MQEWPAQQAPSSKHNDNLTLIDWSISGTRLLLWPFRSQALARRRVCLPSGGQTKHRDLLPLWRPSNLVALADQLGRRSPDVAFDVL